MTVLENIVIGTDAATVVLDLKTAEERIRKICDRYKIDIDLHAKVWSLPVGQQQWVEILKALFLGARLLIMDEPTAVLTPQESRQLFKIFREMVADGMSVILISHKLDEVMQSDHVTAFLTTSRLKAFQMRFAADSGPFFERFAMRANVEAVQQELKIGGLSGHSV